MLPPEVSILKLTKETNVLFEWEYDAAGHITYKFFADRCSADYLSKHPDTLLLIVLT